MPFLISTLAFLTIALLSMGIFFYARERAKKARLIGKITQVDEIEVSEASNGDPSSLRKKAAMTMPKRIANLFGSLGKRVKPQKSLRYSRTGVKFLRAGFRRGDIHHIFWGIRCFLVIFLCVTFLLLRVTLFEVINYRLTVAITTCLAFVGFYLPELWLRIKIRRRKDMIARGFADVLDLLVVCVEAGMGMDAAIIRVAHEVRLSNKTWSEELKFFNLELRAGKLRRDALKNLGIRTDIEDVNSLATLLIQTDKFGTSLAQTLRVYSDTFRTKRYQQAEEIAAKLAVKLVLPLILFIFPSLLIAILGPAAIRVYHVILAP
jgi:tight adherence protein C